MKNGAQHIPVMLNEVVSALHPAEGRVYVDGTFGRGGYSRAILSVVGTRVFGIDRDPEAIAVGREMEKEFAPRLKVLHGTFGEMENILASENVRKVDGVALDVGVSSPQIDDPERGFSFQEDGPLDMRMSQEGKSAADLVNTAPEKELADIIFKFGEERFSRRVARKIAEARKEKPITRTLQLAEIVRSAVPRSSDGIDPATRTFQALRIAVNEEMEELRRGLEAAENILRPEGILAVVSFHSLEDRCVKEFMRERSAFAPRGSRHAPEAASKRAPTFRVVSRKPTLPSEKEATSNPRARSARLRIAERTDADKNMENAA